MNFRVLSSCPRACYDDLRRLAHVLRLSRRVPDLFTVEAPIATDDVSIELADGHLTIAGPGAEAS